MSTHLPILFQSLDRIVGSEGRSKLLAKESQLYHLLTRLKQEIRIRYHIAPDRMDLHIEITKNRQDPDFRQKAATLHQQEIELEVTSNWGYMGRAFVLWTAPVAGYGRTHITVAFFGKNPRPALADLHDLALEVVRRGFNSGLDAERGAGV